LSIALAIFNLLPIPPLDGSKVLFSLLPQKAYYKVMQYERFGMIALILLMFAGRFLGINFFSRIITEPAMTLLHNISMVFSSAIG